MRGTSFGRGGVVGREERLGRNGRDARSRVRESGRGVQREEKRVAENERGTGENEEESRARENAEERAGRRDAFVGVKRLRSHENVAKKRAVGEESRRDFASSGSVGERKYQSKERDEEVGERTLGFGRSFGGENGGSGGARGGEEKAEKIERRATTGFGNCKT